MNVPPEEFKEEHEDFDTGFYSETLFHSIDSSIVKDALLCPLMPHFLQEPLQCPHCHAHFCKKCLRKALELNEKCPLCRVEITDFEDNRCRPSKIVVCLLENLRVSCENAAKGCEKTFLHGESKEFTRHLAEECPFAEEKCGNYLCEFKGMRKEMETHRKNCAEELLICMYCESPVKREELKQHFVDCLEVCKWCGKEYAKTKEPNHVEECEMSWVICLYCQRTVVKRDWNFHRENGCLMRKVVVLNNRQVINANCAANSSGLVRILRNNAPQTYYMYRF